MKKAAFSVLFLLLASALPLLMGAKGGCGKDSDPADSAPLVVAISDFHFTPFDDPDLFEALRDAKPEDWEAVFDSSTRTRLPGYGEETNHPLLETALDGVRAAAPGPVYVVFPGDILTHHFKDLYFDATGSRDVAGLKRFIIKTVEYFILQVDERFPGAPVLFTLGNNDSYDGDYDLEAGGDFLADTALLFYERFLDGEADRDGFFRTWEAGGYYSAEFGRDDLLFLSLNSVLFSERRPDPGARSTDPGHLQLDWLDEELARAGREGRTAYMVTHIPPGADVFGTIKAYMAPGGSVSDMYPLWHAAYQTRFLDIVDRHRDVLAAVYSGHTHMDEFRLVFNNAHTGDGTPVLSIPAVSPIFGNNPAYKVFRLEEATWRFADYDAYALDLHTRQSGFRTFYSFRDLYGVGAPAATSLTSLYGLFFDSPDRLDRYLDRYYSGSPNSPIDAENQNIYRCAAGRLRGAGFADCVNKNQR